MGYAEGGKSRHISLASLAAVVPAVSLLLGAAPVLADSPPAVTIGAASAVSYTSAHISGTVNPEGGPSPTIWNLEYKLSSADEFSWIPFASGEFSGPSAKATTPEAVQGDLGGLTPGREYSVRLTAENEFGAQRVFTSEPGPTFTTLAVTPPAVTIAVPAVSGSSAHFSGEINPGAPAGNPAAFDVSWRFECTPECPGLTGGSIPADNTGHAVEADATGLAYNTTYEVKLIASNAGGQANASQTIKIEAVAPETESLAASVLTDTTAVLGGTVDPNGSPTTYWIEYANNPAFNGAVSIPASKDASAGSGQTPVNVSRLVSALQPDSDYYFRMTVHNAVDTDVTVTQSFHTRPIESARSCTNEALRTGLSGALADCRAYELVSTDLNHAGLGSSANGYALPSGDAVMYQTIDAPATAQYASIYNFVVSKRDAVKGWSGASIGAPIKGPTQGYFGYLTQLVSPDLESALTTSDQSPDGSPSPPGQHLWLTRTDGSFARLTNFGNPYTDSVELYVGWDTINAFYGFTDVFFRPSQPQLPSDPAPGSNLYHWGGGQLHLVGILPDGTAAPSGALLPTTVRDTGTSTPIPAVSADGKHVLFNVGGDPALYLRNNDTETVNVGLSQRTVNPDPNPPAISFVVGVTPDGSKVLFGSPNELTNDAYTGRSGGVATDTGNNLYSYDIASGKLADLTVDRNPADAGIGASIQYPVAVAPDARSIFFTATGQLAPGATPGQTSLYVLRDGHIDYLARGDGLTGRYGVTPDGRNIAFASTDRLTSYDNTDPVTGAPHREVYVVGVGRPVECVSCRADGSRPTKDSDLGSGTPYVPNSSARSVSDDGSRVFFESADAVLPQASSGLSQVFEYSHGKVTAISRPDSGSQAFLLDASASGDDVFFATHDDLIANPNGGDFAVYDARVNGGFPVSVKDNCSGVACQAPASATPALPVVGSLSFLGQGNLQGVPTRPSARSKVVVSRVKAIGGAGGSLRVTVPGSGRLTVSGSGLRTDRRSVSKAQAVTMKLLPTAGAAKALRRRGSFKTKVRVVFADGQGHSTSVLLSITFKAASGRKGR